MLKRMIVVSIFVASIVGLSYPASAAAPAFSLNETVWQIDGNVKTAINFPNIVSLSLTLPKLGNLWTTVGIGEVFYFVGDKTFQDLILLFLPLLAQGVEVPPPTWTQDGSNFTVNITELSLALATALQSSLGDLATVDGDPTKSSFAGKVASNGKSINGKVDIAYNLSIAMGSGKPPITGTFSIKMSFKGAPTPEQALLSVRSALSKAQSDKGSEVASAMRQILSDIKLLIPPKGTVQKPRVK